MNVVVINQMWIWLAENQWAGTDLTEMDDLTTQEIIAEIDSAYPDGSEQFFADHLPKQDTVGSDTPRGTRVEDVVTGEQGWFWGLENDEHGVVSFDADQPGTVDKVNPACLVVVA